MKKNTCTILTAAVIAAVFIPSIIAKAGPTDGPVTESSLHKGLILHFTFDQDAPGGKVTDVSGQGNNGKASGVRWTPDGKKGGAYEFTADGNEIVVPNKKPLNPEQFTLSAWIKTKTGDHYWRRIFDKSYTKQFALSVAGDDGGYKAYGQVCLEMGPGYHALTPPTRVDDGKWHQIVATFDGRLEVLYVDGQYQAKRRWEKSERVGVSDFNLVIGCNRSNTDPKEDDMGISFRGLIDEPMMWNRGLSPEEVTVLYQSQQ